MASASAPAVPITHDGLKVGAFIASMIGIVITIGTTWAALSSRIERNSTKIENTDKRVDNMDAKLDKILDKVSGIDVKLERKQDRK